MSAPQENTAEGTESLILPSQNRITAPSACIACRSKHLKCDGVAPCGRCRLNSFECIFIRSRRGFKGPRRKTIQNNARTAEFPGIYLPTDPLLSLASTASEPLTSHDFSLDNEIGNMGGSALASITFEPDHELVSIEPKQNHPALRDNERCLEAFFHYFYPAHPFLLPRLKCLQILKERPLSHLQKAIYYVGSLFVSQVPSEPLSLEAEKALYSIDCPRDIFLVQALLLLVIGLDGSAQQEKALRMLKDAEDLALEIGLQTIQFASDNGGGWPMLEESFRRTWWELYIVEGMIAGLHQKSEFRLYDTSMGVALPCEEAEYLSGQIPPLYFLQDFDDHIFDGGGYVYSSYGYRIAAIRNFGLFLQSKRTMGLNETTVDLVDSHIVNWRLDLPDSKKSIIKSDGTLDEMLFQAQMMTEAITILVHRELSELDSSNAQTITSCAPYKRVLPGHTFNIHAAKTIQAAKTISKLVTLPTALIKHTHFFTCVVTLSSIIHLSCWSAFSANISDNDLKQQLRLNTGAVKTLQQVWRSAGMAFSQIKSVAQEIFLAKKVAAERIYWEDISLESQDAIQCMIIEDQGIMEELRLLD